jgi:hypothetical protein
MAVQFLHLTTDRRQPGRRGDHVLRRDKKHNASIDEPMPAHKPPRCEANHP